MGPIEQNKFALKRVYSWVAKHLGSMFIRCSTTAWPEKNCQVSIKVAKNDFTRKWLILTPLQKLRKNVGDFSKLIVAKGLKNLPKVQ